MPPKSFATALVLITPSSIKNLAIAWSFGKFLYNNCGWIVLKARLKFSAIFLGSLNKFPVNKANSACVIKFLVWVKGPKIVLDICVNPFGIRTKCW